MRKLFIFRPEPAARQTIRIAESLGLQPVSIPLFELEPIEWSAPFSGEFDGLLLTSANTVKMAGEALDDFRSLPVHAVGEGTAAAARGAGLGVTTVGTGGVDQLLAEVPQEARLLHLCGEDRREQSVGGHSITSMPVYRAREKEEVAGLQALAGQAAVLHSPRAARRLSELIEPADRATIKLAVISEATAEAAGEGWQDIQIATFPRDTELLALAARLCET